MFARKIKIEYDTDGTRQPALLNWLDNFAMRNFTNDPIFDDTLPVADGLMEIGARVPLERLKSDMEDWFRRKGYIAAAGSLHLSEL